MLLRIVYHLYNKTENPGGKKRVFFSSYMLSDKQNSEFYRTFPEFIILYVICKTNPAFCWVVLLVYDGHH